jgi:hypothetical protein
MNQQNESRKLHVVFSRQRQRIEASRFLSEKSGPQGNLFAEAKPGVVVFIHFSGVGDDQFIEVLRMAQPSFVFDLRIAPRFDLGTLNRRAVFALFEEVKATYVDATTPLMMGEHRENAIQRLRDTLGKLDFKRPALFLFGSNNSSIMSDSEVLSALSLAGKPASDLVVLPA